MSKNTDKKSPRDWAFDINRATGKTVFFIPKKFNYKKHGMFTFILHAGNNFDRFDLVPIRDLSLFDKDYETFFNDEITTEELADPNIRMMLHKLAKSTVKKINMIYQSPINDFKDRYGQMRNADLPIHNIIQLFLHYFYREFTQLLKISLSTDKINKVDIKEIWPVFEEDVKDIDVNRFMKYDEETKKYSFAGNEIIIEYLNAQNPINWLYIADDMLLRSDRFLNRKIYEEIDGLIEDIIGLEKDRSVTGIIQKADPNTIIKELNDKIKRYKSGVAMDIDLSNLYKRLLNVYKYSLVASPNHYFYFFLNILNSVFVNPITERVIEYNDLHNRILGPIDAYIKKNYRKFGKITTPNHKSPVKMFNHLMERHQIMIKARKQNTQEYKNLLAAIYQIMEFPESDIYFKLLLTCLNTARTPYSEKNLTINPEEIIVMMVDMYDDNNKTFVTEDHLPDPKKTDLYKSFTRPMTIEMFADKDDADYKTIDVAQVIVNLGYTDSVDKLQKRSFMFGLIKSFKTKVFAVFNDKFLEYELVEVEKIGHFIREVVTFLEISFTFEGEKIMIYRKENDMIYDVGNEDDPEKLNDIQDKLFYHVLTGNTIDFVYEFKPKNDIIKLKDKRVAHIINPILDLITKKIPLTIERLECRATLPLEIEKKDDDEFVKKIFNYYV